MPTVIDVPNAQGADTAWTGTYADVTSDDGDTTNVNTSTLGARESWTFPALPTGILTPVNSASFKAKARSVGGTPTLSILNGSAYTSVGAITTSYVTYSVPAASLVVATLQAYASGVENTSGGGPINVSYAYREADVSYPPGGFTFLLGQLMPLIGAGLSWMQFRAALRLAARHMTFREDEMRVFWREFVAYRHPRFFLPAVA